MRKTKLKQTRVDRMEEVLRAELETAVTELQQAEQQLETWQARRDDLQKYIAERQAALKAD